MSLLGLKSKNKKTPTPIRSASTNTNTRRSTKNSPPPHTKNINNTNHTNHHHQHYNDNTNEFNLNENNNNNNIIYPHQSNLLSRLPVNASTPNLYSPYPYHHHNNNSNPTLSHSTSMIEPYYSSTPPSPFESPIPTPSTSWTSEMSAFVDKLRDDAAAIVASSNSKYNSSLLNLATPPLDRKSVSQGMKLVAIAADEYEDGNDDVALDIYLSGIDKILMALPNKTDPRTKVALREKLLSVEERVGILNLASQYKQLPPIQSSNNSNEDHDNTSLASVATTTTTTTTTSVFSRISTTISTISSIGSTTVQAWEEQNKQTVPYDNRDPIYRFKQFGRVVINASVTCAVLVKQSPIPDLINLVVSYLYYLIAWFDNQYEVREKLQLVGIECVKMILAADEHYHLHELASETLYMLIAASLKAAVAFKESPKYSTSPPPSNNNSFKKNETGSSPSSSSPNSNNNLDKETPNQIEYPSTSSSSTSSSPPPSTSSYTSRLLPSWIWPTW
ncbi:unnamed protein product [Cunninghamella echinulata]